MRTFTALVFAITLGGSFSGRALAQTPEKPSRDKTLAFEAADVHAAAPARNPFRRGPMTRAGRYEIHNATMLDLISIAYDFNENEVLGGPSWLEMNRYDVIAKPPDGSTPDIKKAMLKTLLADRFNVTVHPETKPMPAMALTVGKKLLIKPSEGSGEADCEFKQSGPMGGGRGNPDGGPPPMPVFTLDCHNMTMEKFVGEVRDWGNYDDKPVLDHTGLKEAFDFVFKFTPNFGGGMRGFSGEPIPFADSVEKQLGLKLEQAKLPVPVLVVDGANEKPSPNAPDIAKTLHETPPPTEFEVADVKSTSPDFRGRQMQIQRGGRVNMRGWTLKTMIQQAWNLTDEMVIGAPKWWDDDRYDVIAKAFTTASDEEVDIDTTWTMMQGLLKDRFKLVAHMEDRPVNAYTLSTLKPKMQKADPASRTRFREGPGTDGKDPRNANPSLSRLVNVQNMTMDQFCQELQRIAGGYIKGAVQNSTGLAGAYDFTLSFSPAGMINNLGRGGGDRIGPGGGAGGAFGEASEPSGAVSLFEAIDKQLGLKLEMQKRVAPVLVIDHLEQKPTEN